MIVWNSKITDNMDIFSSVFALHSPDTWEAHFQICLEK